MDIGADEMDEGVDFGSTGRPFAQLVEVKVIPCADAVRLAAVVAAAEEDLRNAYLEEKGNRCFRSDSHDMARFGYLVADNYIVKLTKKATGRKLDLDN